MYNWRKFDNGSIKLAGACVMEFLRKTDRNYSHKDGLSRINSYFENKNLSGKSKVLIFYR